LNSHHTCRQWSDAFSRTSGQKITESTAGTADLVVAKHTRSPAADVVQLLSKCLGVRCRSILAEVRPSSLLPSRLVQPRLGARLIAAVDLAARFSRPRQRRIQGFDERVDGQRLLAFSGDGSEFLNSVARAVGRGVHGRSQPVVHSADQHIASSHAGSTTWTDSCRGRANTFAAASLRSRRARPPAPPQASRAAFSVSLCGADVDGFRWVADFHS
jgi:hypothetical protein